MNGSNRNEQTTIDKRDFDANRPSAVGSAENSRTTHSRLGSRRSTGGGSNESSHGLLSDVVEGIVECDRQKMEREVVRVCSFIWGIVTCLGAGSLTAFSLYGPLFLTRLHYTQLRVNAVAIAAEIAMYLPVPIFGYLCDRYTPSPLALCAGFLFGGGYLLAAFSYRSGPPPDAGGRGWPFSVMVVAFVLIGMGTCSMYLAAVATCAKNFGRGKHKGFMLAVPIAAFGLSGMWQSQVGTYLLCERLPDGTCDADIDVFRYFIFLSVLLFVIGVFGTFTLRIVDEEEERYIGEAVGELERSALLDRGDGAATGGGAFFRSREEIRTAYGTFNNVDDNDDDDDDDGSDDQSFMLPDETREARRRDKEREQEERRMRNWLLNLETRMFFKDQTMWWLAGGFFLISGPGEAYINNVRFFFLSILIRSNLV